MHAAVTRRPIAGVGLGLRAPHYQDILDTTPEVPWFEVLADNYLQPGGKDRYFLDQVAERYPTVMHAIGMSIGSCEPLRWDYLRKLKQLKQHIGAAYISDHLCWCSANAHYVPDLLPLPYNNETIVHIAGRISAIQDYLGEQILIENLSSYVNLAASEMTEWEFLNQIAQMADCYILLDINNIYVSSENNGFAAEDYLFNVDVDRVKQFHLAGFEDKGTHLLDNHGAPIHPPVWQLYEQALGHFEPTPTLIEWDNNLPDFATLLAEQQLAERIYQQCLAA